MAGRRLEHAGGDLGGLDQRVSAAKPGSQRPQRRRIEVRGSEGQDPLRQLVVGQARQMRRRERVEAGLLEPHLAPGEPRRIEAVDQLIHRQHLSGAGAGDQAELIHDRLRRVALSAQLGDRRRALPLGQLAMLAEHHRMVQEHGHRGAQRLERGLVQRPVGQVVVAANDVGDRVIGVVDNACPVIGRTAVGADDDERADALAGQHQRAVAELHARGRARRRPVTLGPIALAERSLVPADAQPAQVVDDRLLAAAHRSGRVRVVDPQEHRSLLRAGEEQVGERRQGAAQVQRPGGAGGEADAYRHAGNVPAQRVAQGAGRRPLEWRTPNPIRLTATAAAPDTPKASAVPPLAASQPASRPPAGPLPLKAK